MSEYLKDSTCMKSLVNGLVVACDETEDKRESSSINPRDGTNCWLIAFVLL